MLLAASTVAVVAIAAAAPDISGTWTTSFESQVGVQTYTYTFKVEGEKLTGKCKSQYGETEITEGVVKGDDITFVENLVYEGMPLRIVYKGKISGDEIKFSRNVAELADEPFVAKRAKQP